MLQDKASDYFLNKDKNCAEAVFLAANDIYNLGTSDDAVKSIGVFGGGIGIGRLCGAAAGAVTAIGLRYSKGHAHGSSEMMEKASAFITDFTEFFKSDLCKDIKPVYRKDDVRCLEVVKKAAELLEKYM